MDSESNESNPAESKSSNVKNNGEKIEVNFDVNPTKLYNYIQQRKWKAALDQVRQDRSETWTWVYRMDKEDPKKMRWRILPLHAALLFKSDSALIKGLLEAYPIGVQMADDQGMLPVSPLIF